MAIKFFHFSDAYNMLLYVCAFLLKLLNSHTDILFFSCYNTCLSLHTHLLAMLVMIGDVIAIY